MGLLHNGPKVGGAIASLGLGIVGLVLMPRAVGYQELAALIARQMPVVERSQGASLVSPLGPVQVAGLSLPQPVGTALPPSFNYTLAGLDPANADITVSIRERMMRDVAVEMEPGMTAALTLDRRLKGDRLDAKAAPVAALQSGMARKGDRLDIHTQPAAASVATAPAEAPAGYTLASVDPGAAVVSLPNAAKVPPVAIETPDPGDEPVDAAEQLVPGFVPHDEFDPRTRVARLYFGAGPMGETVAALKPWGEGEAPKVATLPVAVDPDASVAATLPLAGAGKQDKLAMRTPQPDEAVASKTGGSRSGETIAAKGEVTGVDQRPKTPAERLGLNTAARAKAEKCLANAI